MKNSEISWTDHTWNVAVGCTRVNADCKNCYMYRESMAGTRYDPMAVRRTKGVFTFPLSLKEPSRIFTSSLTDFFHPEIDSYRDEAWAIIRKCPQHIFQILTKRPERIAVHLPAFWPEIAGRVWMGASIGSMASAHFIDYLTIPHTPGLKWLSVEPMHGPMVLDFARAIDHFNTVGDAIKWIVVGGESGNLSGKRYVARPCELAWIEAVVNECRAASIPVFVKQLGTVLAKQLKLKDRHGRDMAEWPEHLQVRQFPTT